MTEQTGQVTAGSETLGMGETNGPWWAHAGLTVRDGRLLVAGRDAEALARRHGTPLYVYDLTRAAEQIEALQDALDGANLTSCVRMAMKAQHEPEFLDYVRRRFPPDTTRGVGLDVSSPGELLHALHCGWPIECISYTGTNLSEPDLDVLLQHPVHINLDGLSQLKRVGVRARGRRIGVRLNPRAGAAHGLGAVSLYSGDKPTKFGIYPERLSEAVAVARQYGMTIVTAHTHVARMILNEDLPNYEAVLKRVAALTLELRTLGCPIEDVNVG